MKARIDHLPMDRQAAGYKRPSLPGQGMFGSSDLETVFEKRDVDPESPLFRRRYGSTRLTNASPNILGITTVVDQGRVEIDYDFTGELASWTAFLTARIPEAAADGVFPLFHVRNIHAYIEYTFSTSVVVLKLFDSGGNLKLSHSIGDITAVGTDHRIAVRYTPTKTLGAVTWPVGTTDPIGSESTQAGVTISGVTVGLMGASLGTNDLEGVADYDGVITTNFLVYNVSDFSIANEYEEYAADLTPDLSGTNDATTAFLLRWHETFEDGGEVFSFTNSADTEIFSYLTPSPPNDAGVTDAEWIHFGGEGVIEVPFYLDFDEYYWTQVAATARTEWMFQLEITLPTILSSTTVFEFEDICRLVIRSTGGDNFGFGAYYAGTGSVLSAGPLVGGAVYQIFVGRNAENNLIRVVPTSTGVAEDVTSPADNPAIFLYDKMLGFTIGNTPDQENSAAFGGQIKRFALHNESTLGWMSLQEAVLYYDIYSLVGDQILDRGNRALNAYGGSRLSTTAPYYAQGGFTGGAYVAATGGYTMAVSTPDLGYVGELKRAIQKDAVVQRRGSKSFLTTNGVNYLIDDFSKTFRPLGIPRPTTKVSCTPQGVGVIDGFVRYAYRWVTKDGTVGPAFDLDPVDARSGVNVFLGAENFGPSGETPFGISYGECEGSKLDAGRGETAEDSVETFIVKDTNGVAVHHLLKKEQLAGLTLETAVRIPNIDLIKENIFSQGVAAPSGVGKWMADHIPYEFPWIGSANQECAFQFAFRYCSDQTYQVLFGIGARDQRYETGNDITGNHTHHRTNHLVVSIQPPADLANTHSIVICRDNVGVGADHRDNALHQFAWDYNFQDGHDYCIIVRRGGFYFAEDHGSALIVNIYDATDDDWMGWPDGGDDTDKIEPNFWGVDYIGGARDQVMWGASRHQGNNITVKTRKRDAAGSTLFNFDYVPAIVGGSTSGPFVPGTILYHGRMWRRDFPTIPLMQLCLDRYGARGTVLSDLLEVDLAFCPDSSRSFIGFGWDNTGPEADENNNMAVRYYKGGGSEIDCIVVLTENTVDTPILTYGWDMTVDEDTDPDTWTVASLDKVPMWVNWSNRNEGSLAIGVGNQVSLEIATKKWYAGAELMTFEELAGEIDLRQWTWITLFYYHYKRQNTSQTYYDVWLRRIFLDGNTGEWGQRYDIAVDLEGIAFNVASGPGQYGLFMVGGLPGRDQEYEVEHAETRLWDGERYYSFDGVTTWGSGDHEFGDFLSNRIPPNHWDKLWYYLRYMKTDCDDPDNPTTMDQVGAFTIPENEPNAGEGQLATDAVTLFQQSDVKDATDGTNTGYFIPFPTPPMSAIRGIQIFRTQVVPVTESFPGGGTNPSAVPEAWRACRNAPLYFLSEIPRGTNFYTDTAADAALGIELDALTGLIPRNPRGVFEWEGYLGIYVQDQPRIHFSESPDSWESFPLDLAFDLPVREYGAIEAAVELASRDARQSRVLCLGKSWGVFIDGTPLSPQANTLGGGVGATSSRCLVVEKGIAYAYNGTLWGITGDGQVEDLSLSIYDLLPDPNTARLSVSSALSSLFVIDEVTGIALRFHLARRQWFVEDRYALSVSDVDGVDTWVHVSGYPSEGDSDVYQDDVESDTPEDGIEVTAFDNSADEFTVGSVTGLKIGQRVTLVGDGSATAAAKDPRERQSVTIMAIDDGTGVIGVEEDLDLAANFTDLGGTTHTLAYNAYVGVGYWGTMIDTGQFNLEGDLSYVDVGIERGDGWWAAADATDFATHPTDRTGFASGESQPTNIVADSGRGESARWGLSSQQRLQRLIVWSPKPTDGSGDGVGLTELDLNYTANPKEA